MPEVTVIIPTYNNEKYIEKCVRSVLVQTFPDLEILAVNDGSTDGTAAILEKLAREDRRIRVLTQKNQGVSAARNNALDHASGTYLTFLDGDDYLEPDYIENLLNHAKRTHSEMVICGLTFLDEEGKVLQRLVPGTYRRFEHEEWTARISGVWAHFYRRELWERYHIRFSLGERGEDMPVALFFSAVCDKISTMPGDGYCYVQHPDSAVHNFKGLKQHALPYRGLENAIKKVSEIGVANSPEFYELFVLRILATCYFQFAPGADAAKKKELCEYIYRILGTYFPEYCRNKKARMLSGLDIPFSQKAAVRILIFLTRTKLLYPVSRFL